LKARAVQQRALRKGIAGGELPFLAEDGFDVARRHDDGPRRPRSGRPLELLLQAAAAREVSDEELESLIEDIYASRLRDVGRRVELEA
jgi:hypothetical protein